MIFTQLSLGGAYLVEPEVISDDRGSFTRTFCSTEFARNGLLTQFPQCNTSFNRLKGTVRGMHFQRMPRPEAKLIRCTRGKIFDVIVDLRPLSRTFLKWHGQELSEDNRFGLYVPAGFAHGFQTLVDSSEIFYQMAEFYDASLNTGVRFNDPAIDVHWPLTITNMSEKDLKWPDLNLDEFKTL